MNSLTLSPTGRLTTASPELQDFPGSFGHPAWKLGTPSRVSSAGPCLQQIPKAAGKSFPGLMTGDFSKLERRVLAGPNGFLLIQGGTGK